MITNTDLLYAKMKEFQDKRVGITEAYDKSVKSLERFKGSQGYEEDLKKLKEKHEADLKGLRDDYRPSINTVLSGMMEAVGRRSISAPTEDQINLLNVLKMKKRVTLEELSRTAEAVKDNPIAIAVVSEIAKDHGIMRSFYDLCPEMSSQRASDIVTGLMNGLEDYLKFDTKRAARIVAAHNERAYGVTDVQLPKRNLFNSKEEFYREEIGLEGETFKKFSEIVDA